MNFKTQLAIGCVAIACSGVAHATYIVNTGTPDVISGNAWLTSNTYYAGEFTVANPTTINSIEGYLRTEWFGEGNVQFALHNTNASTNTPSDVLFSTTQHYVYGSSSALNWHGVSDLGWSLTAGTYWVSLTPDRSFYGSMPIGSPSPLSNYAQGDIYNNWVSTGSSPGVGIRVDASPTVATVPEPETYAMLLAGLGLMGAVARRRKQQ
jgi:hypothetical protein